jgi:hypothetical protein
MNRLPYVALAACFAVSIVGAVPGTALAVAPSSAPTILWPTEGSSVGANPILSWGAVSGAAKYRVQVATASSFASPLYNVDTVALQATPPSQLPWGVLYWRVAGVDSSSNVGPYSTASFTKTAATAPVTLTPADTQTLHFPTDPVLFTWQPVPGATSYTVQVDNAWDFIGAAQYTTANTSYAMIDTQAFTMSDGVTPQSWWWRVQANFPNSQVTAWSTPWSYQIGWPDAPQLESPADGAMGVTEVVFSWDPVPGAATYQIQVSPNGDWQNNTIVDATVDSTRYSPYPTLLNQSYYWRVRARAAGSANNLGQWSTPFVFTRSWPARPVIVSPHWAGGADPTPIVSNLKLSWTPAAASGPGWVDHADRYELWISTDLNFSSGNWVCYTNHATYTPYSPIDTAGEPGSCDTPPSLNAGVTYYWRVRGIDATKGVLGLWDMTSAADTQRFIYMPDLPDPSCGPSGGAPVAIPILCWSPVSGAIQYRVTINKSNATQALQATTYATTYTPTQALNPADGPFSWYVQAQDAANNWGPIPLSLPTFSLTTPTTDTSLALLTPADTAAAIRMPSMSWQPYTGASYYEVFYGATPSIFNVTPLSGSSHLPYAAFTYTAAPLPAGTYYWKVKAFDVSNAYLFESGVRSFSVGALPDHGSWVVPWSDYRTPECIAQTDPQSGNGRCTPTLGDTQELSWAPDPQAGAYEIYVAKDVNFTNVYRTYETGQTTLMPRESWLDSQAGESYYWFVRPCIEWSLTHCGPGPDTTAGLDNASAYRKISPAVTGLSTTTAANPPVPSTTIPDQITFKWSDYITTSQAVVYPVSGAYSSRVTQEAKEYVITVATAADFNAGSIVNGNVRVDQTQYTPWSLTYPEGPLYWRVQAVDGSGNLLTMSATGTVTKASAPISLVSPAAGATVSGVPYFTWTPQNWAAKYTVEVYRNGDTLFSPANRVLTQTTPLAAWAPTSNLAAGDYAWRVQRLDQGNRPGPWSTGRVFTLRPSAPTLIAPPDLSSQDASNLLFTWGGIQNAVSYKFQSSVKTDFSSLTENVTTVMTAWSPTMSYAGGTTYYWRVSVLDAAGNVLNTSGYWTFTAGIESTYVPLTPARILDTRDGTGGLSGPFRSHVARTFQVTGHGGVPTGATAVTGNLTVTLQTSYGYLYLGPVAMNNPTSSTLNFPLGDNRANAVTVALGTGGTLSITYVGLFSSATAHAIFDVTGYFMPDKSGATYFALTPARILDTRYGTGGLGTLPFTSNVAQTFQVTGHGGVPTEATAVTGNLTVTQQTSYGYLFLGPIAMDYPTSSTLNFPLGDDRANAATVALGAGGTLSITYVGLFSSATAHVIFDVTGYFVPGSSGAKYVPLNPARILDTRDGTGGLGLLTAHYAQTFHVTGHGGVPLAATAVTGNLTVTLQSNLGYLFLGPIAMNNPTSSTLNFPLGDNRANAATVALGTGGTGGTLGTLSITYVGLYDGATTHAIFDVTGYFVP